MTKRVIFKLIVAVMCLLWLPAMLSGNNIQVSNISLYGQNTTDDYVMVKFDLSWENSWRTSSAPGNWDAAWVFVKYRITAANGGDDLWKHAWLNNTGHSSGAGTGAIIDAGLLTPGSAFNATTNPGLGAFIYRSANGTGNFSITSAQLRWNYGANGVPDNIKVDVQVFAIEMVYVPQGNFSVGTGADPAEGSSFTQANSTTGATVPFLITSTPPTIQGNNTSSSSSNLGARGSMDLTGTNTASLATGFPTGYNAFYMQKYEITQQQYVDFLNTLTRVQQDTRTGTALAVGTTSVANRFVMSIANTLRYRNGIRCDATIPASDPINFYCDQNVNGTGGESNDGQWIACNYLSWMDGAAYSDWAGLRPMTELEFEKACRGTLSPVAYECAWGDSTAIVANNIANPGAANETTITPGANVVYNFQENVSGPMRVGVFAKSGTTREQSGASYYGVMELSGNLDERPVTVGNATGRAFSGVHGNGALSANGNANQPAWPGLSSDEVTGATGSGFRGGDWDFDYNIKSLRTSTRSGAASTYVQRRTQYGFRAVRTFNNLSF
jgi:formylglycine-generating enzyme required for sulfatase activity